MRTLVAGTALRIWRVACKPLSSGIATSIRTIAGCSFFDHGDRLTAIAGFADHFQIIFELQNLPDVSAHVRVVVCQ